MSRAENKYARDYYKKNKKYREEKIEDRKKEAKANRLVENEYAKQYYWSNAAYRKKKRAWAIAYKKRKNK